MTNTLGSTVADWESVQRRRGYSILVDPLNNVGRTCSLTNSCYTTKMLRDDSDCMGMFIARAVDPTERKWIVVGYAGVGCFSFCPNSCVKSHHRYYLVNLTAESASAAVCVELDNLTNLY